MSDIAPVKTIATTNISPLSAVGQPANGYNVQHGDRVLLNGQSNATENGIWVADALGEWKRAADFDSTAELVPGLTVFITHGDWARYEFFLDTNHNVTPGSEPLSFSVARGPGLIKGRGGVEVDWPYVGLGDTGVEGGTLDLARVTIGTDGRLYEAGPGPARESYIEGLGLSYVNATTLAVEPGAAYIPALGSVVGADTALSVPRLVGLNLLFYVYLAEANGVGVLRLSTTPPAAPYFGYARHMQGDPTARYLGMVRNGGFGGADTGNLIPFDTEVMGGDTMLVMYGPGPAGLRLQVVGASTTAGFNTKAVGPSAVAEDDRLVSPAARTVVVSGAVTGGNDSVYVGYPPEPAAYPPYLIKVGERRVFPYVRLSPTQQIGWQVDRIVGDPASSVNLDILGYYERR